MCITFNHVKHTSGIRCVCVWVCVCRGGGGFRLHCSADSTFVPRRGNRRICSDLACHKGFGRTTRRSVGKNKIPADSPSPKWSETKTILREERGQRLVSALQVELNHRNVFGPNIPSARFMGTLTNMAASPWKQLGTLRGRRPEPGGASGPVPERKDSP